MSFVDIPAPHGRLEGFLWAVESPRAAAVVCHPHPQHGGTMHNHVAYRIARAFRDQQVAALRFNFRGVGRSTGTYDEGRGELEDAHSALDFLEAQYPGIPLYIAGFSFGSRIALRLAVSESRIMKVLAAGLAVDLFDYGFIKELRKPAAFIQADRDEYADLPKVESLIAQVPGPRKLFVIPDSDHLCTGRLKELEEVASSAVCWLLSVDQEAADRIERQT
jgi:alpha/beta superfamily hydrolase